MVLLPSQRARSSYDVRRWSTVFPLGMTAAATLSVVTAMDVPWLDVPGEVLVWISVAGWLAVAIGAVASARDGLRAASASLTEVGSTARQ